MIVIKTELYLQDDHSLKQYYIQIWIQFKTGLYLEKDIV